MVERREGNVHCASRMRQRQRRWPHRWSEFHLFGIFCYWTSTGFQCAKFSLFDVKLFIIMIWLAPKIRNDSSFFEKPKIKCQIIYPLPRLYRDRQNKNKINLAAAHRLLSHDGTICSLPSIRTHFFPIFIFLFFFRFERNRRKKTKQNKSLVDQVNHR